MIVAALSVLMFFSVYLLAWIILTGILHVSEYIERENDKKDDKHKRYKKLFKYMDSL